MKFWEENKFIITLFKMMVTDNEAQRIHIFHWKDFLE